MIRTENLSVGYGKTPLIEDICLRLRPGQVVTLIGPNGSGKSTLLKAVTGVMEPRSGSIIRRGSVAALLELASGFDGDLTVRENAYLLGAMLGYLCLLLILLNLI